MLEIVKQSLEDVDEIERILNQLGERPSLSVASLHVHALIALTRAVAGVSQALTEATVMIPGGELEGVRACRICGCTDDNCLEDDLCSACVALELQEAP